MKTRFAAMTAIMFFSFCLSAAAYDQQARLEGYVYEISNGMEISVAGVRVIAPGGQSQETDSKGHFVIDFPNSVQPGQATRIEVNRPGWLVRDPFFGECATQNPARNFVLLKIIIVPKGSPLALEPKQLSKVIARWANERARLRGQVTELGQRLDEYAFLHEYAKKYGLTLEEFWNAANQWAYSKEASDNLEAGWKEYWKENYGLAAQLGASSKNTYKEKLRRDKQERLEDGRQFIRSVHLEGNARYAENDFRAAMTAYQEIETAFNERELVLEDFLLEWAETKNLLGNAKSELGIRVEGRESQSLLAESVTAHREALKVYSREQLPQAWAATQNNLGAALSDQGERSSGAEGVKLLAEAVIAYLEAFKVRTREVAPQAWADTQNNLGNTLWLQGERSSGEESVKLLAEAVTAHREALKVRTHKHLPQDWAMTQNNLGVALKSQGERSSGKESVKLLAESVTACREALKVRTRKHSPQQWAATQNNLGVALALQGERASGEESVRLLAESAAIYREVLKVYTREHLPQQWATTQSNLGTALSSHGEKVGGKERVRLLAKAVTAYHEALKVNTREHLPQAWAITQNNLAKAYYLLKDWVNAATSYANVLELYPEEEESYQRLSAIYHERLFEYAKAFELHSKWLARFPNAVSVQAAFVETHFTTARFTELPQRVKTLLANPDVPSGTKAALQTIEIANLLALGQAERVLGALDDLLKRIADQKSDFRIEWSFNGTLHFINERKELAAYRSWLTQLFGAADGENRVTILKKLREAQSQFKASGH